MRDIKEYREVGTKLYNKLRLLTSPVAIKFVKNISEFPEKIHRPSKMGTQISLCQAFTLARRWGAHVGMTYDDNVCITSSIVHQWEKLPVGDIIKSQVKSGYHKDMEAELKVQSLYKAIATEKNYHKIKDNKGFIASPLIKTIIVPDVILVYGDPAQMTHILQSFSYEGKYLVESPFIGYGETCLKGVLLPFVTGKPQVVLPGTGDRSLSLTKEGEMAFGFPGDLLFYLNENLFKSGGRLNFGQPTKFLLGNLPE
ncbi:MAG: hypothetical protein GF383_08990, partial [Candidatus Lokiarchaeota archaeon]|nr:hypothetical protein [Candidatus Lokiarchaeota archaeon]MBD3340570.1 hypothetical protein [Candidatus Lokiarchaeota archaeon]